MARRGVRVIELEDFMCRCGSRDFQTELEEQSPVGLTCKSCGRHYSVQKREKRTRMTNLPMSFGFRSLYWDKIQASKGGIFGISEQGYEIREDK